MQTIKGTRQKICQFKNPMINLGDEKLNLPEVTDPQEYQYQSQLNMDKLMFYGFLNIKLKFVYLCKIDLLNELERTKF